MKHLFNIVPTVKFREGSTFMFKTIIVILYSLPLLLATYTAYECSFYNDLEHELRESITKLDKRKDQLKQALIAEKPKPDALTKLQGKTISYFQALHAISFSWTALFENLETLLPENSRLNRIQIRPATTVQVSLSGEAQTLQGVMEFWRRLFAAPRFARPRISTHKNVMKGPVASVEFHLDVDYVPDLEFKP
jgi:Tfp pilus assembly protein PilN